MSHHAATNRFGLDWRNDVRPKWYHSLLVEVRVEFPQRFKGTAKFWILLLQSHEDLNTI